MDRFSIVQNFSVYTSVTATGSYRIGSCFSCQSCTRACTDSVNSEPASNSFFCRFASSLSMVVASSGATTSGMPERKTIWAALMSGTMLYSACGFEPSL